MRLKGWIWFIGILIALNAPLAMFGRQLRFDCILVHHSAGRIGDLSMIRAMHKKRGWTDAAYHLILSNGSTQVPAGYLEATTRFTSLDAAVATHDAEANRRDLHICIVGNYEQNDVPAQLQPAIAHALLALCNAFSIDQSRIIFHRDVNNTACPGKHLTKQRVLEWIKNLAGKCPQSIREQQLATIAASSLSLRNYPRKLLAIQAGVSLLFILIWTALLAAFRPDGRNFHIKPRSTEPLARRKKPGGNRYT